MKIIRLRNRLGFLLLFASIPFLSIGQDIATLNFQSSDIEKRSASSLSNLSELKQYAAQNESYNYEYACQISKNWQEHHILKVDKKLRPQQALKQRRISG